MINLNDYKRKPFGELQTVLLRCGYHISGRTVDRKLKLTGVTFIRTKSGRNTVGGHSKVSVWHCWEEPDSTGIARAGIVTDIEFTDLDNTGETENGSSQQDS